MKKNAVLFLLGLCTLFAVDSVASAEPVGANVSSVPISDTAPEMPVPEPVAEAPERFEIEIYPKVKIDAPNTDNVSFFESELDINPVGDALVSEYFYLVVTDKNKGLPFYRKINKQIKTPFRNVVVNPEIVSASYNDALVPFTLTSELDYNKIAIGDSDKGLPVGVHKFNLKYKVPKIVLEVDGYGLLAWDILGTGWTVPVLHTALIIHHPETVVPTGQSIFFNGRVDQKIKNYSEKSTDGTYNFLKNQIVNPTQNLVFLETFDKGAFLPYTAYDKAEKFFTFDIVTVIYLIGLLAAFIYYFTTWFTVNKEDRKIMNPSIADNVNRFFSPAAFRLFVKRTLDAKLMAIIIINLAAKGMLKIEEKDDGSFVLVRQAAAKRKAKISTGEAIFFARLFPKGQLSTPLNDMLGRRLTKWRKAYELPLQNEFNQQYLRANYVYFLFGLIIVATSLVTGAFFSASFMLTGLISAALAVLVLLAVYLGLFAVAVAKSSTLNKKWLKVSLAFLLFVLAAAGAVYCAYISAVVTSPLAALFMVMMLVVVFLTYHLFKSENKLGKAVRESAKLYNSYLGLDTPLASKSGTDTGGKMLDLFMRHIPYALAVDLDEGWSRRFADTLAGVGKEQFVWYNGKAEYTPFFVAELAARLAAQCESTVTFLNPKLQKFK